MAAEFGVDVRYIQADMSKGADCRALIEKAGACDILVNNADSACCADLEFRPDKVDLTGRGAAENAREGI